MKSLQKYPKVVFKKTADRVLNEKCINSLINFY